MPLVLSSHFSSTSVLQETTSSCTSCTSCLVQHSDSYSVLQISGPCTSQSFTRGVLQTVAVSLKAICSYSMKQLFLMGLVVGGVGGVAPPVVGVVALHHVVVLCLLHHLHLVDAPLSIGAGSSSCHSREAHVHIGPLSVVPVGKLGCFMVSMMIVSMVLSMMLLSTGLLVEGEGVGERALIPINLVSSQTTRCQGRGGQESKEGKLEENHLVKACRCEQSNTSTANHRLRL